MGMSREDRKYGFLFSVQHRQTGRSWPLPLSYPRNLQTELLAKIDGSLVQARFRRGSPEVQLIP